MRPVMQRVMEMGMEMEAETEVDMGMASSKNDGIVAGQMAGSAFKLDDEDEGDELSTRPRQAGDLV
jgi:hypothetical protein